MIKLALLIPTLDRSGAEKQLTLLASGLPRGEFDVHVIALTRGGPFARTLAEQGVKLSLIAKRWKFDVAAFGRLRRLLRDLAPDILHTWLFAASAYGRLAAGRSRRPKIVVSERCVDSWKADWQLRLDRRLIPRTDRLIGNSRSVADFYADAGVPRERIAVIPNAVEPPPPPPVDRQTLLKQLNLPGDAKLIAHVGRLARQKRIDDLLWGLQVLRQADPRAYFLIIGDGPERDRLLRHARDVECADHVRFLGHREDAASLMHCLDVFWLGSDFEGMSNSLMEAMCCGLPVVVTDIPPNRELVTHECNGLLAGVGDGVAFAQFTKRLFDDPPLARRLGEAARRRMADEFSVGQMVSAHVALYRDVMRVTEGA